MLMAQLWVRSRKYLELYSEACFLDSLRLNSVEVFITIMKVEKA